MDQLDQDLTRFKKPGMAAVGGIAAALVVATLPAVYLEKIIGFTGIAEIISAAAPPLGNTAKGLIAVTAGLISASIVYLFLNQKGGSDMGLALPKFSVSDDNVASEGQPIIKKSKFSLKKLLQKPRKTGATNDRKVMDLADLPKLREADAHPDAPARRPIFAEADLGSPLAEKIQPFEAASAAPQQAAPPVAETRATTQAPFVADKQLRAPVEHVSPHQVPAQEAALDLSNMVVASAEQVAAPLQAQTVAAPESQIQPHEDQPQEDMSALSIADLASRLEAGLARLKQLEIASRAIADPVAPEAAPVVPAPAENAGSFSVSSQEAPLNVPSLKPVEKTEEEVQAARQADMDAALKAALGTLEKMTAHR